MDASFKIINVLRGPRGGLKEKHGGHPSPLELTRYLHLIESNEPLQEDYLNQK
jgi:hypothetical protein